MSDGFRAIWTRDPAAIAYYRGSGPVYASAGFVGLAPLDVAWQGLVDLHQRSIGMPVDRFSSAFSMSEEEAFLGYGNALAGVLGQLAATDATAGNRILESLNGFADFQGGLDGLFSVYFSSYLSAGRDGSITGGMEQAAQLFGDYGFPDVFGGGAATAPMIRPDTGVLSFPGSDVIQQAMQPGSSAGQIRDQLQQVFDRVSQEPSGPANPSQESSFGHSFASAVQAANTGAAFGAVAGGAIGGPPGALVGGIVGGVIGFVSGLLGGSPSQPPAAESSQAAKDAAAGSKACVTSTVVIVNGNNNTINVGKDGSVHKDGPAPSTPAPSSGSSQPRPAPSGSVLKCWLGPDEQMDPDFSLPYWGSNAILSPAIVPTGPGAEALMTLFDADMVSLADRLTVDQAAEFDQEGFLAGALGQSRIPVRAGSRTNTVRLATASQAASRSYVLQVLQEAGISASTTIEDLSVALRTPAVKRSYRVEDQS